MKILYRDTMIIGTATDDYTGSELFITGEIDITRMNEYRIENGELIVPEIPDAWTQKLSELAAYRYEKETAGITVNGALIRTDEYSQGKINGAWSTAQINPAVLIDFKGVNGWVKLNAAEITAIAEAVSIHVQSCFSTERIHSDAIAALETSEAVTAYDLNTGWPR